MAPTWIVALVKPGDASGLTAGDPISLAPTTFTFGAVNGSVDITLATPIVKEWDGALGHFTETLTTLTEVVRGLNQIGFTLTGSVTGGAFVAPQPVWFLTSPKLADRGMWSLLR